jgi:hypothetical protein
MINTVADEIQQNTTDLDQQQVEKQAGNQDRDPREGTQGSCLIWMCTNVIGHAYYR